jgi:serine/threonine-protein kinase
MTVSIMSARVLGGRYQLHAMLGRGGMAAVWAGVDTRLDRPIAVKVVDAAAGADPAMLQRLDREARTIARLAHPNIVAVYDVGVERDMPYLVMELVDGDDLQQRLAHGPLAVPEAVRVAAQVCDALEAAHRAGVVHRDVKPENILLTRTGVAKVCDFGIARLQQAADVTSTGATIGTSEYMAPEQATGGPVDARTDLYGLGCVLYAMLAGGPPFAGEDPQGVLWQQVYQAPALISSRRPGIPAELDALVAQLLAKNPGDRPATAGQVRALLADLPGLEPVPNQTQATLAAGDPIASASARAAVVTRTRAMPAVDVPARHSAPRSGFRLGLGGIAAVAVGAAAVTALVVALLMAGQPTQPVAAPEPSASGAGSSSVTGTAPPIPPGTVDGIRGAILALAAAGELDPDGANSLVNKLNEIDRHLGKDQTEKAADKVDDLRDQLAEFRNDGRVSEAGFASLVAGLDQLASTIPADDDRGRD